MKSDKEEEISDGIPNRLNLKRNDTNQLIYKTETDLEHELMIKRGKAWTERIVRESGMDMYTLLYLKWITHKDLLYSTWNSAQCYVPPEGSRVWGENETCICVVKYLRCSAETTSLLIHHGAQSLSRVQLFVTPWTVVRQASLSTEFSRPEHWSG